MTYSVEDFYAEDKSVSVRTGSHPRSPKRNNSRFFESGTDIISPAKTQYKSPSTGATGTDLTSAVYGCLNWDQVELRYQPEDH